MRLEGQMCEDRLKRTQHGPVKNEKGALAGIVQWTECRLRIKGLPVRFPIKAHAWVVGQVPSRGHVRGNHTLMFVSLSFSLPSPLSKNKLKFF